jgi:hypothetical protein
MEIPVYQDSTGHIPIRITVTIQRHYQPYEAQPKEIVGGVFLRPDDFQMDAETALTFATDRLASIKAGQLGFMALTIRDADVKERHLALQLLAHALAFPRPAPEGALLELSA